MRQSMMRRDADIEFVRDDEARSSLDNVMDRWARWCRRGCIPKLGHPGIAPEHKMAFGSTGRADEDDLIGMRVEGMVLELHGLDSAAAEALRAQYVYRGTSQQKAAQLGVSVSKFYAYLDGGRMFLMGKGLHREV